MLSSMLYVNIVCNDVAAVSETVCCIISLCCNVAAVSKAVCCVSCSMMALCVMTWQQYERQCVV